jgi:hypothetical protein
VVLEDEGAHATALGEFGEIYGVDAAGGGIGGRVDVDVDDAVERLGLRVGGGGENSGTKKESELGWSHGES